ncbi:MAG: 5'-nucleotidase [Aquihabitans sp.]
MAYGLEGRLVIGVASSALFDLTDSDEVFRTEGETRYRRFQEEHLDDTLQPGVAFGFIKRLLALNDLTADDDPIVEVIILSRNDPETGLRVMRSVAAHGLDISRAIFTQGRSPNAYIGALNMALFLSGSSQDVRAAVDAGLPAGQVVGAVTQHAEGRELRIAFDFDGVLADDTSERVMQAEGLDAFHAHERSNAGVPSAPGYLQRLLRELNRIQDLEDQRISEDSTYERRVRVAIVTARSAPAHERVVQTLKAWNLRVNDAFFLGGIEKARVLRELRPHIFFDDQMSHLESAALEIPSVHVPFGITNQADHPSK